VTTGPTLEGSAGFRPWGEPGDLGSGESPAQGEGPILAGRVKTVQKPVYYVSEVLHEAKARYPEMHKLLYAILIAFRKLHHYFKGHKIVVVTFYPLRAVLHNSNATGNIAKWAAELAGFLEGAFGGRGGTSGCGWDGGGGGDAWRCCVGGGGGGRRCGEDRCTSSGLPCGCWRCNGGGGA
jgi:hypothetical protein